MTGMWVPPMPWRILAVVAATGAAGGAIWGFVRGLANLPTLPFAVVEGAILFGVPASILGLLLAAVWSVGSAVRRRAGPDQT